MRPRFWMMLVLIVFALAVALATAAYQAPTAHAGVQTAVSRGALGFYEPDALCMQGCSITYYQPGAQVEVSGFAYGPRGELYAVTSFTEVVGPYPPFSDQPLTVTLPVYVPVNRLEWSAPWIGWTR